MPVPTISTSSEPEPADTVVVGGGIGGLLAAISAAPPGAHRRVVVLEPHALGGRGRCDQRDGYTFNRGPRALYVGGPAEQALVGLGVDARAGGAPVLEHPLAVLEGRSHRFPDGPLGLARTTALAPRDKLAASRVLAQVMTARPGTGAGLTLAEWLDARGVDGRGRALVEALVRVSTYSNAPSEVAAAAVLHGTRKALRTGVRYLDGGWQPMIDALGAVAEARGVQIWPAAATRVTSTGDGQVGVAVAGGTIRCASAVLAVGTPDAAAALLGGPPSSWGRLGPAATVACLELGVARPPRHRFSLGLDEPTYASTHCPPADLAPPGRAVVHLMRYQPAGEDADPARDRRVLDALAGRIGVAPDDVEAERFLSRMVVTGALPRPSTDRSGGRPPVAVPEHPGISLVGDWVGPEHLLLDAVAASALEAGRRARARSATMVAS